VDDRRPEAGVSGSGGMALPASALTPAATAALFLGPGFIDVQRTTVEFPTVQRGNCLVAIGVIGHFDKAETFGAARIAVRNDVYTVNCAINLKHGANRILGGPEAEVSYENIFHLIFFLKFAGQQIEGKTE
jgi:hypothetical protein